MIEGTLINLRAFELTDVDRMTRWVNDPETTRTLAVRYPWSHATEENWLKNRTSQPLTFADLGFAIETKDGAHIGNCGLHKGSPENRSAELGIFIGESEYRSKGYGTDAARTLVRFAFDEMNLHRVELHVFDFNERAIASYRKCGFIEEARLRQARYQDGVYHDVLIMAVLRDEAASSG